MKKFFIGIVSFALFVFFACNTFILKSNVIENWTNYKEEQTKLLCDVKDCYDVNKAFNVSFITNKKNEITSFSYESQGLDVNGSLTNGNEINFILQVLNENELLYLKVNVFFKEELVASNTIYGYSTKFGTFMSKYSYGHAKQLSYEYLVNSGSITEEDLFENINSDINQNIIYEKTRGMNSLRSSVELSTKLVWIEDGETEADEHPLAFTKFQIIDNNASTTHTYYTNENGDFPEGLYYNTPTNLSIKIFAAGENTNVLKRTMLINTPWVYEGEYDESVSKIIVTSTPTTDYGRAQQVSQALIYAEKYARLINGSPLSPINALYPASSTDYTSLQNMIRVSGESSDPDYADWDVIMHEYGHHVTHELNLQNSPAFAVNHSSNENLADRYNKSQGIRLAWSEALSTIFGSLAQEYYSSAINTINFVADGAYSDNGFIYNYDSIFGYYGDACERSIIGILWDIFDGDTTTEIHDNSAMTHPQFWSIMIDSEATTLSEYVNYYYSNFSDNTSINNLGKILEYYHVAPSDVHLPTYTNNLSYNAPTFYWSANGTSDTLLNNRFKIRVCRSDLVDYIEMTTTNNYLSLTESQWNTVLNWPCRQIMLTVYGYQDDTPATGPYGQGYVYFNKPQYEITCIGESATILGLYYNSNSLNIPSQIDGKQVVSIANNAFYGCTSLESIIIPDTVESIGSNAFKYCSALENVTILRGKSPITSLGLNAFDNCASNLTITVPTNRLCEYKNTPFWSSYRDKIVPSSPIIDDIDLDCMIDDDVTTYLNAGYNKLYRLDVECDGWYTISCTSGTHYSIYNSNMVKIAGAYDTYELTLNEGTYYIDIEWEDPTDSGYATLHFLNKGINVSDNITNNILPHLHNVGTNYKAQLKYYHTQGAGYYKFTLTATSSNSNPVEYILGAITMYTAFDRNDAMNKYSDDKYTLSAESLAGENSMVVYLPSNGYYYFDVKMNTNSLSSLVLNITPYISSDIDLFDCSVSSNHDIHIINTNVKGDYFQKKVLKQKGKFIISFTYTDPDPNNISSSDVVVVVAKVTYNANTNTYSFTKVYSVDFCEEDLLFTSYIITNSLDLDAGTYYIGYFNNTDCANTDCANIKVDFVRQITQYGSYNLISDPNSSEEYGSEVRFNNGSYLGSTLTVGFTRFIYLNYDYILPSYSRLDYYFYSSNDSIASISEYGTLLGKSAGTVKIMAVYKSDPSITFVKQFTILADNRVNNLIIYDTDSIDYTGSGQLYQIELDDYNSYFPQISLYNWILISSSNNYSYSISEWGTFSLYGADIIVIEGTSKLNSKIKIRLTITVTN